MDLRQSSRALFAALAQKDPERALSFFAPRCRFEVAGLLGPMGRAGLRRYLQILRHNVPDLRYTVRDVAVSGDRTYVTWRAHGHREHPSPAIHRSEGLHVLTWTPEGLVRAVTVYTDPDGMRDATRVQAPLPLHASATLRRHAAFAGDLPHHRQKTDHTCGPAALRMVLGAFGQAHSENDLARDLGTEPRVGTRQLAMVRWLQSRGMRTTVRHTTTTLADIHRLLAAGQAVIVCYWMEDERTDHYAVVRHIGPDGITLADPWRGPDTTMPLDEFEVHWRGDPHVGSRRDRWLVGIRPPAQATRFAPRAGEPAWEGGEDLLEQAEA
ncbi:MAG TPA: nuclear transport factor 2 family protein [Candidatus Thermoplasmatota archaeon]|nr:nuclear transport factor 2 family protein [Candidatus Thermoplasmatota archaeon]